MPNRKMRKRFARIEGQIHAEASEILRIMANLKVGKTQNILSENVKDLSALLSILEKYHEVLTSEDKQKRAEKFFETKLNELDEDSPKYAQQKKRIEKAKAFYLAHIPSCSINSIDSIEKEKAKLEEMLKKYKKRERTFIGRIKNFINKKKIQKLNLQLKKVLEKQSLHKFIQGKQKRLNCMAQQAVQQSKLENKQKKRIYKADRMKTW